MHIAVIMDGNGRWAAARHLPRTAGHAEGAKVFRRIADHCADIAETAGIERATFFAFSTENKFRPAEEISALTGLFEKYLDDIKKMAQKNVRLSFHGDLSFFSTRLQNKIADAVQTSAGNTGITIGICVNYGGRGEIAAAARAWAENGFAGELDRHFTIPDADLLIRTGGEKRISNFLLWQSAYAEIYFEDKMWCDFTTRDLDTAVEWFKNRNRRFGKI